jgi:hypothetical protein
MVAVAIKYLIGFSYFKMRDRPPDPGGAAKLPLAADFAGPFTWD